MGDYGYCVGVLSLPHGPSRVAGPPIMGQGCSCMPDEDRALTAGSNIDQAPEIRTLLLADRAEVLNGKLYVMGGAINIFYGLRFPTALLFGVALVVAIPWNHTNEDMKIAVVFSDADGNVLGRM